MKFSKWLLLVAALFISAGSLTGCDTNQGPMEKAGEAIDEGVEEVVDEIDDATDAQ